MSAAGERRVLVVGAGLAGLVAATAAREQGAHVTVLERDDGPGGATRHSVGWIWRYRDLATARACAPHADAHVTRAVIRRLDDDIAWLEELGVQRRATGTGRAITEGIRIDPAQALDVLARRLGEEAIEPRATVLDARPGAAGGFELRVRRGRVGALADAPEDWLAADAVVFAGGGYAADLARIEREAGTRREAAAQWVLRAPLAGDGSSMDSAIALGALRVPATGESLARVVPAVEDELPPRELGRYGELHLPGTVLRRADGSELQRAEHDWSGAQLVWELARSSGAGRLEFERAALRQPMRGGSVEDLLRSAVAAGAETGRTTDGGVWLAVRAGITHTLCGLRVDGDGRLQHVPAARGLLRRSGEPRALPAAFAAGCDAAGSGLGGTASGLAQALVLGRRAGTLAAAGR